MTYRWQETIKILIPGLYFLLGWGWYDIDVIEYDYYDVYKFIEKSYALLLVLSFCAAFVLGYVNEIISGEVEYIMYRLGVPRPSRTILNNTCRRYRIERSRELRNKLNLPEEGSIDNDKAEAALALAKQSINMDACQEQYYQSVLSRNLFFAHLFTSAYVFHNSIWSQSLFLFAVFAVLLFWWQWQKMNMVYVKNIFLEYLKKNLNQE